MHARYVSAPPMFYYKPAYRHSDSLPKKDETPVAKPTLPSTNKTNPDGFFQQPQLPANDQPLTDYGTFTLCK